jgi:DNA invertase Pin-like site-specific DNA recombinase
MTCEGRLSRTTNDRFRHDGAITYLRTYAYNEAVKVAIYCRVSTRDKGQETANQRLQLERFARKQGWKVAALYEDRVSGKRGEGGREAFKQMFVAAARREWDFLLFWSLDRFSREGAFPTLRYLTRLSELGVSYRSYTEEYINSTGIFGDVIVSLLATLAKQETIRLSERTIAGLERARAQGRVGGRPRIECDRERILKLHAAGKSLGTIAKQLGMSKTTVHRVIKGARRNLNRTDPPQRR